jgi:hypothetical protein
MRNLAPFYFYNKFLKIMQKKFKNHAKKKLKNVKIIKKL